jgi:N-acetylglucosaminyl-diphospho-decaprenol L-rhamnosyltransferase
MSDATSEHSITPVLVTYNSATILPWSLPPLAGCREVIVVDNHSSDDTAQVAQRLLPQSKVIAAGRNLGFGRANNLGLAAVTTPYALLLNPDARLAPQALQALHAAALRYPDAAILAPVLYDAPGIVGDFFRGPYWQPAVKPAPLPEGDLCADFVTGAAMLLNLEKMREVGFFDPWFFLYCEDDDLCLRVRKAGHPIIVVAAATMEHKTRQSSQPSVRNTWRRTYTMTLSKFYITRKYFGGPRWMAMALRVGTGSVFSAAVALLTLRKERLVWSLARLFAALKAPVHLRRVHCFEPAD